jgi:hypothetical protein
MDKCIYYLKAVDNNDLFEKARTDDYPSDNIIHDDIDYEKEGNSIERGNYKEEDLKWGVRGFPVKEDGSEEEDSEEEGSEEEGSEEGGVLNPVVKEELNEGAQNPVVKEELNEGAQNPVEYGGIRGLPVVKHKLYKKNTSVGVDDIQKLPLDWFQNVKENYKKNQIIPRKKYITFEEQPFRDPKKKI